VVDRANTPRHIERLARDAGLTCESLHTIHDPTYFAFHPLIFRINAALADLLPDRMAEHLAGVCTK
jgi:hypothetical protein